MRRTEIFTIITYITIAAFSVGITFGYDAPLCIKSQNIFSSKGKCKKDFETVQEASNFLENALQVSGADISRKIPFEMFLQTLEKGCSENNIKNSKIVFKNISSKRVSNVNQKKIKAEMEKKFPVLLQMNTKVDPKNKETFCSQKYLLFSLLEYTQNIYQKKNISSSQKETTNTQQNTPSTHQSASINKTTNTPVKNNTQTDTLQLPSKPTTNSEEKQINIISSQEPTLFINGLIQVQNELPENQDQNPINQAIQSLSEKKVKEVITNLAMKGIFDQQDIKNLKDKITINYISSCGNIKGKYHMTTKEDNEKTIKQITLNVNLCYDESYLQKLGSYISQITAHELGHYIYYFKDSSPQKFTALCRKGENNICTPDEFITLYAQKSSEEDYAEHFMQWYQNSENQQKKKSESSSQTNLKSHGSATLSKKEEKQTYFETLFG